jgi:excisionase family DNA binding protein
MVDNVEGTVTIAEAARLLNVHRNTVRNRIKAGRYKAYNVVTPQGKTFAVVLESIAQDISTTMHNPSQHTVHHNDAQGAQGGPLATNDQQDAVVRLVQQMLTPFVQELGETKEELGRVRAERDIAQQRAKELEAERDSLASRIRLVEDQEPRFEEESSPTLERSQRVWWRFWER